MMIRDTPAWYRRFFSSLRMAMSWCSSRPYSSLRANQRESQVRLMPSRNPIGLTF